MKFAVLWTFLGLLVVLLGSGILLRLVEGNLIFFPAARWDLSLSDFQPAKSVWFQAADGVTLSGVWLEAETPRGVILYCHGNAGNLSHRIPTADLWRRMFGFSIFLFDYRGYGRSQGRPNEEGIYQDTLAAFDMIRQLAGESPVVVYGRSLGTVPATRLAGEARVQGLILDSPLTNAWEMASRILPLPGIGWLTSFRLDNLKAIRSVKCPLLILHGAMDEIIPLEQAQRVFQAASDPKDFLLLEGMRHNDDHNRPSILNRLKEFLDDIVGP